MKTPTKVINKVDNATISEHPSFPMHPDEFVPAILGSHAIGMEDSTPIKEFDPGEQLSKIHPELEAHQEFVLGLKPIQAVPKVRYS